MIECFCIMVCMVLVIDQFHFVDEITTIVCGWMTNGKIRKPLHIKPFSCSLCSSFWLNLIYITATHNLTIPMVLYILVLSWLTPVINDILTLVIMTIKRILGKLDI